MKVCELRAFMKERRVRGYSTMRKEELEERVRELKEKEENANMKNNSEKEPFIRRVWKNRESSAKSLKRA